MHGDDSDPSRVIKLTVGNSSILRNASGGPENYNSAVRTSSEKSDSMNKKSETVRTTTVSWADIVTGKGT